MAIICTILKEQSINIKKSTSSLPLTRWPALGTPVDIRGTFF